jgi:hypothetical protein
VHVIHPPGYRLFNRIGGLFPDPVTAIAAMNVLFSVAGVVVFYYTALFFASRRKAFLAALAYSSIYYIWFSGEVHRTYALQALFSIAAFYVLLRYKRDRSSLLLWLVAVIFAVGAELCSLDGIFLILMLAYYSAIRQHRGMACIFLLHFGSLPRMDYSDRFGLPPVARECAWLGEDACRNARRKIRIPAACRRAKINSDWSKCRFDGQCRPVCLAARDCVVAGAGRCFLEPDPQRERLAHSNDVVLDCARIAVLYPQLQWRCALFDALFRGDPAVGCWSVAHYDCHSGLECGPIPVLHPNSITGPFT